MKQARLGLATVAEQAALDKLLKCPTLRDFADSYMRQVIEECGGDIQLAAAVLGVGRASLYRWKKRLDQPRETKNDARRVARVERLFVESRGKW